MAIAAGRICSVEPNGKPHTARSCCSNWLVTLASKRQVAGIVRTRRELIDQQTAAGLDEKFHAQDADDVERFEHRARDLPRARSDVFGNRRRRDGHVQNTVAMPVFDHAVIDAFAIDAARRHDRDFAFERDERFKHRRHAADGIPGGFGFVKR